MAVASTDIELESIGVSDKSHEFVRNNDCFDVYAIDVWLTMDFAKGILL